MKKSLMLFCSLLAASQVYAVNCPRISMLQQSWQALDSAIAYPPYLAYGSKSAFDFGGRDWFVGMYIKASSKETAIQKGQEAIKAINQQLNEIAIAYQSFFLCVYAAPNNVIINALSTDLPIPIKPMDFLR